MLVIATDWNEYRHPNFARLRSLLAHPIVVDGRNLYDPAAMARLGFSYFSIGRPACVSSSLVPPASSARISATASSLTDMPSSVSIAS